ncbi:hypothetical protein Hanom_Chr02g00165351 [Helianthus anomalus]
MKTFKENHTKELEYIIYANNQQNLINIKFNSHLVQSEPLVGNYRRPRETWVRSLSQTGFTGNFTVVPTGGWVTGFSPELVVDSAYSQSTPFGPVGAPRVLGIDSVGRSKKIMHQLNVKY